MSTRYWISDHHFGHKNQITEYGRKGLFKTTEEMTEHIIRRHNEVVKKSTDIVYFVGDFSFLSFDDSKRVLERMRGRKILIQGNHDLSSKRHLSTREFLDMGFEDVLQETFVRLTNGVEVFVKHYPYEKSTLHKLLRFLKSGEAPYEKKYHAYTPVNKGYWHIHGHIHAGPKRIGKEINVNADTWDYYPVSEKTICKIIDDYESKTVSGMFKRMRQLIQDGLIQLKEAQRKRKLTFRSFVDAAEYAMESIQEKSKKSRLFVGFLTDNLEPLHVGMVNTLISGDEFESVGPSYTAAVAASAFKAMAPDTNEVVIINLSDSPAFLPLKEAGYDWTLGVEFTLERLSRKIKEPDNNKTLLVIAGIEKIKSNPHMGEFSAKSYVHLMEILSSGLQEKSAVIGVTNYPEMVDQGIKEKLHLKIRQKRMLAAVSNQEDELIYGEALVGNKKVASIFSQAVVPSSLRKTEDAVKTMRSILLGKHKGRRDAQ